MGIVVAIVDAIAVLSVNSHSRSPMIHVARVHRLPHDRVLLLCLQCYVSVVKVAAKYM